MYIADVKMLAIPFFTVGLITFSVTELFTVFKSSAKKLDQNFFKPDCFFTTAAELLERPYELDIASIRRSVSENEQHHQLLPPDGLYRTENEKGDLVRLEIQNGKIISIPDCEKVKFI